MTAVSDWHTHQQAISISLQNCFQKMETTGLTGMIMYRWLCSQDSGKLVSVASMTNTGETVIVHFPLERIDELKNFAESLLSSINEVKQQTLNSSVQSSVSQ